MHEVYEENLRLEHEMTELLGELQRAAQAYLFLPPGGGSYPCGPAPCLLDSVSAAWEAVEASRLIGLWYFQGRTPWPLADRALQDISSQQSSRNWGSWSCWRRDTSTTGRGQSNPDLRDDPEGWCPLQSYAV